MKVSITTYSYKKYMEATGASYLDVSQITKELGYDGIEFTTFPDDPAPYESRQALAKAIKAKCDELQLPIVSYTVHADFLNSENEVERVKGEVDIAEILGVPVLRHDAFWGLPEGKTWRECVDIVAPRIREVTEYAATKGIRTCTENHGKVMQDADRVEKLILTVNHPNYGWLVDIGNFLCADDNPLRAVPIAARYAFHVHVKDFVFKAFNEDNPGQGWIVTRNGNFIRGTVPGHGVVPIRKSLKTLKENGYDGYVSCEFEGMEDNIPAVTRGLAFIRSVLPD